MIECQLIWIWESTAHVLMELQPTTTMKACDRLGKGVRAPRRAQRARCHDACAQGYLPWQCSWPCACAGRHVVRAQRFFCGAARGAAWVAGCPCCRACGPQQLSDFDTTPYHAIHYPCSGITYLVMCIAIPPHRLSDSDDFIPAR